uniref:Reverse transcriptase domain-containing protein n=1 Tax=Fagus sylvatica TaxID=28930 RepID=A0A2N9I089_FAGSY
MSGAPSASRRPPSVVVEDASSSRVSSGTSYRPSRDSREPQGTAGGVAAGRASVIPTPPQQPTPPHTNSPTNEGATSRRLVPEQPNRGDARRSLAYSTNSQSESRSPTPPAASHKPSNPGKSSRSRPPLYGEKSQPEKKHQSRKTVRPGRQNAVWKAFDLISSSPFSKEIEKAKMPERYPVPRFEIYNGQTDPVTHIGHYHQSMALSRNNDPLMCRLFPSSLGEVVMRWFNQLGVRTIYSWDQLAEAFVARFITNSRKRKEMGALLTMKLEDNEMLKDYSTRFWETYNDIESCGEEVAITTFKMGLPADSGLRQSLVKHPPANLGKLMYKIDQFVRIEEDGRKAPVGQTVAQPKVTISKPAARAGNTSKNLSAPRNFVAPTFRAFETVFKEPIYKVMEKIKRELFFVWPPKMVGNPALKDGNLYCSYHRERGHMTENCHLLKVHLEKLASAVHLDQYINRDLSSKKETGPDARQPQSLNTPSAGIIHVIHNPSCSAVSSPSCRSKMQKAAHLRRSFSIQDAAHPAPMYSVNRGNTEQVISFSDNDLRDVQLSHNDPLVVTLRIGNYDVQRVLIDQGSFAEVMYQDLYGKLGLVEAELTGFTTPIFGFSGEPVIPLGKIVLPVLAGPINLQTEFIVVQASSPYNAIMGRDWLHRMKAIPSTLHQKLRFPTAEGIMELNGDQVAAKQCVLTATKKKVVKDAQPAGGSKLSPVDRECLLQVLIDNQDIFAWSVYDAPGVSPDLASHTLNIKPEQRPVVQKRRKLAPERATIVLEEVERLLASGAIREVQYPAWLSNTVVVRKKNGKWRVCIDFIDLNKACPKDPFPLPRIDQLVDSASRHARLSFLDAFQGYHQIPMNPADQEKTAFITPRGTYCYRVMPFGLKNAGATYQRMVTKMFGPMIGKTVEVYIDDMLIKSLREENHIADLLQVFDILRRDNLRLNASKCTFGVGSGKFLGHIVSRRGIEANPDQIAALINLAEPRNVKQPFFRLLGKRSRFEWDEECSAAFQAIKAYLSTPPCLSIPNPGEPLFLYLAVSDHAVSAVLVRELMQEQRPVFFVSKAMDEAELRYLPLEKAALALLHAAKKLPHYFQSSTVTVLSDLPLKMLLQRSDFTGRITRWGVYLGSLGVEYRPRTAIKGQVLAEFLAEFQYDPSNPPLLTPAQTQFDLDGAKWKLFVDGASNSKGSGAGIVLISPEGLVLEQAVRLKFSASNNEAEYEAMLIGLRTARKLGADHLQIFYILAKLATALESDIQRTVCIETLEQPSFQDQEVSVCSINIRPSWMDPILNYIRDNKLPEDKKEAKMIKQKGPEILGLQRRAIIQGDPSPGPYLLCVHPDKVKDFLFEIHEGICGSHTGGRSLAHRALSQGYWWPYMQADALKYVQECDKCQRFAPMIHQPARELNPLSSPWPFAQWGLDIVGPLPRAPGNKKFLITATDYFTNCYSTGDWNADHPNNRICTVRTNEDNLRKDLDLVEERRDLAMVYLAAYQQRLKREHNKNVKPRTFRIGDLVLRKVMANTRRPNEGKLGPNWEGPYKVLSQVGHGAYRLEDLNGKAIPRPWNTCRVTFREGDKWGKETLHPNNTTTSRGVSKGRIL